MHGEKGSHGLNGENGEKGNKGSFNQPISKIKILSDVNAQKYYARNIRW